MRSTRLLAYVIGGVLTASGSAFGQEIDRQAHVRPEAQLRALVEDATHRSPSMRQSMERLETLDVTVYIRARLRMPSGLEGSTALLSVNGSHRYLVIDLAAGRSAVMQMSALGHELFHAMEIAIEPSIVDARTLAAHYTRIGDEGAEIDGKRSFETQAAAAAGARVREELVSGGPVAATEHARQSGVRN